MDNTTHRLNLDQKSHGVDIQSKEDFDAEIANLEAQLEGHKKTFEEMDNSDGVGYIAAEGQSIIHDHYNGKLEPDEYLSHIKKNEKDYGYNHSEAVERLYYLLLDENAPLIKTENGKPLKDKRGQNIPTDAGFARKGGKPEILRKALLKGGMLDEKGQLIPGPQKAEQVISDILSAVNGTPFSSVYAFRRLLPADRLRYLKAVSEQMDAQGIEYQEFQGNLTGISQKDLLYYMATDKHQGWFLGQIGSNRLATTGKKINLSQDDRKPIKRLGQMRYIGIDIAGPESQKFTDEGMKRWQSIYAGIDTKAKIKNDEGTYVLRRRPAETGRSRKCRIKQRTRSYRQS